MSEDPASYLTLEPGSDVMSADGERVGAVEHVLRDGQSGIFDGIVIDVRPAPGDCTSWTRQRSPRSGKAP